MGGCDEQGLKLGGRCDVSSVGRKKRKWGRSEKRKDMCLADVYVCK